MTQHQGESVAADDPVPSIEDDAAAGEPHQHQEQTVHASIEPSDFDPQQSQLQPDLSEHDQMAEAMKESLTQHEREEAEKHQYDAYQLQDQEYEPDLTGPLVSELRMTSELEAQFADADVNFQTKIHNLAKTHEYWRSSRGDGDCGWRAIVFCYYELLLRLNSHSLILSETARLSHLTSQLDKDYAATIDDFREPVDEMMRMLGKAHEPGATSTEEREAWLAMQFDAEDPAVVEVMQYKMMYFRILTRHQMQLNREDIEPFLEVPFATVLSDITIPRREIDQIYLKSLFHMLLEPAGIGLEVLELTRSPGEEVGRIRWEPEGGLRCEGAWVRLLFRPGHYDIIYSGMPGPLT